MSMISEQEFKTNEERCECGKLLVKVTMKGLEFKCNRCKRIHIIRLNHLVGQYQDMCEALMASH